jgi:hypothetical protein
MIGQVVLVLTAVFQWVKGRIQAEGGCEGGGEKVGQEAVRGA